MAKGTHLPTHWPRNFRPLPNNFGALFNTLDVAIGNGSISLTGTATTTMWVGVPASRTWGVESAQIQGNIPAAGAGTITAQLILNSLSANADYTQTAATSIKSDVVTSNCVDFPITATGANRTGQPGDTLRWEIVAATTVTTQPTLVGVAEIAIQY
jgi:hypothetical protein